MKLEQEKAPMGAMSAMLGGLSMGAWLIPIAGALLAVGALYTGNRSLESEEDGWATAGMVLGGASLVLTILRSGIVYYYG